VVIKPTNKIKTFGLDRMSELEISEEHFSRPGFTAKEYFKDTFGISHYEKGPENVRMRIDRGISNHLLAAPMHPSMQKIGEEGDWDIIAMDIVINIDLINELMTWMPQIAILSPDSLRESIVKRCEKAVYNNSLAT